MEEPIFIMDNRFPDNRGWFTESFNRHRLYREHKILNDWRQDNLSFSRRGVIRGMHYQLDGLAKLVRCVTGRIVDVVVDLRRDSDDFRRVSYYTLSGDAGGALYVPPGFGHGFIACEDSHVIYKVDRLWDPELEGGVRYDDEELSIEWSELSGIPSEDFIVSDKDKELPLLAEADLGFYDL